jgi:L-threonylcarbamoyladenylate synthase
MLLDAEAALAALANGGVVGLPTDTVYGLAASLGHPSAVAALFALKGRPTTVALPVLVSGVAQIESLGVVWPARAHQLSTALWPGALTIIVGVPRWLSTLVGSRSEAVGFRNPNDGVLRELLERSGPLALTSANAHGQRPCENADQLLEVFFGRGELSGVIDGGSRAGVVSTVIDLSAPAWRIVREGAIGEPDLAALLD